MDSIQITLIHGTFASEGLWFREGSFFRIFFLQKCEMPLEFHPFIWDGGNSHSSRLLAAKNLKSHILEINEKFPNSKHYLISHSHGGNVALYASKMKGFDNLIEGVVTFGTPFIKCSPNKLVEVLKNKSGYLATFFLAIFSLILLIGYIFSIEYLGGYYFLVFFLLSILLIKLGIPFLNRFNDKIIQEKKKALNDLNIGEIKGDKLFIGRVNYDEAGIALRTISKITIFPHSINDYLDIISRITLFFQSDRGWGILTLLIFIAGLFGFFEDFSSRNEYGMLIMLSVFIAFGLKVVVEIIGLIVTAITIILATLAFTFSRLLRSHSLGFGNEYIYNSLLINIKTSQIPKTHTSEPFILNVSTKRFAGLFGGLRHSVFYENKFVIQSVVDWISKHSIS